MSGRDLFETWSTLPVHTGMLVALMDDGVTPLVIDPAHPELPAVAARTIVDLHGEHVGRSVVLLHEAGDPARPIVMGVLKGPVDERPACIHLAVDGERAIVSAQRQLVLRCGRASITLTEAGKVLIEGAYVLSRSTGVNRVKGGSVQLN